MLASLNEEIAKKEFGRRKVPAVEARTSVVVDGDSLEKESSLSCNTYERHADDLMTRARG